MLPERRAQRVDGGTVKSLGLLNAPPDVIAATIERARAVEDDAFPVWPEHRDVVHLFVRLATQWRWDGGMLPAKRGLDYAAIRPTAGLIGVRVTRPLFDALQVMEGAALEAMADRREAEAQRP